PKYRWRRSAGPDAAAGETSTVTKKTRRRHRHRAFECKAGEGYFRSLATASSAAAVPAAKSDANEREIKVFFMDIGPFLRV
ncbi:MAG: hypothetical protein ACREB3_05240, partial [Burkholderiales bacterium]